MTAPPPADGAPTADVAVSPRWLWALRAAAALTVVAGVAAAVWRPLAPDLGPAPAPQGVFDPAFLERAAQYRVPIYVVMALATVLRLALAGFVALTASGRSLVARVTGRVGDGRPARGAAAVIVLLVVATDVLLLPAAFWLGFVHDGAFGLRTQGVSGWVRDWLVFHVPVWLGVGVLALLGYALARRLPRTWPAVAGIGAGVLGMVVTFASPLVLEPLSFDFQPLPQGPVRIEVERVLAAAGEEIDDIVVADASRRSIRQNAYVSGLGASRRVVLYDTLIDGRPVDEVGVVVAHELGHRRHRDLLRSALLGAAGAVIAAHVVAALVRRRTLLGRQDGQHDPSAAAVVMLVVLVMNVASIPLQSWVSRRAEAAADLASLDYTASPDVFERMQVGLAQTNVHEPAPPSVVTWWWGSHPTAMARIGMARWWAQR